MKLRSHLLTMIKPQCA